MNLIKLMKPIESRIEKQKQEIIDQKLKLENMEKELDRIIKLKEWAENIEKDIENKEKTAI